MLKRSKAVLGLASYYRRYIQNFASIADPLNHLLGKDVLFSWGGNEEAEFSKLKELLVSYPVLLSQISKGFSLYVQMQAA